MRDALEQAHGLTCAVLVEGSACGLLPAWVRLSDVFSAAMVAMPYRRECSAPRSVGVEEWCDQREHLAGPPGHADVRGRGEHGELRVWQEFEHLHYVGQG